MALSPFKIVDEINKLVPSFEKQPDYLRTTCVQIAQFLHDGGARTPNFLALEQAMIGVINSRLTGVVAHAPTVAATFVNRVNQRALGSPKLPAHLQNVLSTVLRQAEITAGLSQPVMFTGFVAPADFQQQVRDGRPFKDPAVPYGHGEFTHRIQWYLVFQAVPAPLRGWGEFYRWVGEIFDPVGKKLGLWDILFDRNKMGRDGSNGPYNTAAATDFRSPENLHTYLRRLTTCPVLRGFIEGRHRKRQNQGLVPVNKTTDTDTAMREYLSRKIFGVPYSQLPRTDRATLNPDNKILVRGPMKTPSVESQEDATLRVFFDAIGW